MARDLSEPAFWRGGQRRRWGGAEAPGRDKSYAEGGSEYSEISENPEGGFERAARLRSRPASLARFMAEWRKRVEKASGVRAAISASVMERRAGDGANSGMAVGCEWRLKGQTVWHVSQP